MEVRISIKRTCNCVTSLFPGQSNEGDVRLRRGNSDASGYVEIYHNGAWGRVCDTGWTHENAHVICKQLGKHILPFSNISEKYCINFCDRKSYILYNIKLLSIPSIFSTE